MSERMDTKLRELTFRLVAMAPEAPPFPEEAMVQLEPAPAPAPVKRRRPLAWAAVAAVAALLVVGLPLYLFGPAGDGDPTPVPPASITTPAEVVPTTVPEGAPPTSLAPSAGTTVPFSVYLFSEELTTPAGDPALVAIERSEVVAEPTAVTPQLTVALAIESLLRAEVEPGYTTAIPRGSELIMGVNQGGGVVAIDLPAAFESGGGTAAMTARLTQVVFTATQVPEVDAVLFMIEGEVVDVFSSEGLLLDGPQTRADYFGTGQRIYVDTPAIGSIIPGTVGINGSANTADGTVQFEISERDGTPINSGLGTIGCGADCWGQFAAAIPYTLDEDTDAFVTVVDVSSGERVQYPVTLLAATGGPEGEPCSTSGLDVALEEQPGLPAAVAEMRRAIYDAAMRCDIPGLAALADAGDDPFNASFGGEDALSFWTEAEQRGEPILADLVRHLNLPYGVDTFGDPTSYFWPSAQGVTSIDEIPAEDYAALLELYSAEELANMYEVIGGYVGWRIGITEDGDWRSFVQGD